MTASPLLGECTTTRDNPIPQSISNALRQFLGKTPYAKCPRRDRIRAVKAAMLAGTEVVIVGFSRAMVQTVVEQGSELPQVRTYRDLRRAPAAYVHE